MEEARQAVEILQKQRNRLEYLRRTHDSEELMKFAVEALDKRGSCITEKVIYQIEAVSDNYEEITIIKEND